MRCLSSRFNGYRPIEPIPTKLLTSRREAHSLKNACESWQDRIPQSWANGGEDGTGVAGYGLFRKPDWPIHS
jgi:hypothetical protein